jgi:hypothetical protein
LDAGQLSVRLFRYCRRPKTSTSPDSCSAAKKLLKLIEAIRTNASRSPARFGCPPYAARNALAAEPTEFSAALII